MKNSITKKLLAAGLTAIVAAGLLAGCAGTGAATPAAPAAEPAAAEAEAPAEEAAPEAEASGDTINLNLYRAVYNVQATDEAEGKAVNDAINARLAELGSKARVTINELPNAEYGDKSNLALASGEVDILWTANWWGTIGTNDLYKNNAAYDLSDLLPGTRLWDSMPEWYWEAARYDGKDLFVPVYKEGAEGYSMKFLQSNADKIGGVDIASIEAQPDIISKLAALEPYMAAARDAGIKYPYSGAGTAMFYRYFLDSYDFIDQTLQSQLAVSLEKDEVINPIITPEYADFCKLMGRWGQEGYIALEEEIGKTLPATLSQTQDWLFGWWTSIPNDKESEGRDGNQAEGFIKLTKNWGSSHTTLGSCFAVSANCSAEKAEAAVDFLGYLFTDNAIANLYTYGIEGTDYVIDENGKVDRTGEGMGSLYNHSPWESTSVKAVTLLSDEPDDKIAMYDTFNGSATGTVSNGFRFDHSAVEAQYTACLNLLEEYGRTLECGAYAPDDVDSAIADYQAALDAAGYQDVLAACQEQYEAWKATR